MKLNQKRKDLKRKGYSPERVEDERVNWTVDVLPAIDSKDIKKYGDQMIQEIKERKFQEYCKDNDLDESNFVNSTAKKLLKSKTSVTEKHKVASEKMPASETQHPTLKNPPPAAHFDSKNDPHAQKKQRLHLIKQKLLQKFQTMLEEVRGLTEVEADNVPWHKHIKFDETGKIDPKAILHRFNINKKMHVDPHNFEIDQTSNGIIRNSIKSHEERRRIKSLLHLLQGEHDGVLNYAIYIDGMADYAQEKAVEYIKGSEEKRNQVRLYLELLKETRSEKDQG